MCKCVCVCVKDEWVAFLPSDECACTYMCVCMCVRACVCLCMHACKYVHVWANSE